MSEATRCATSWSRRISVSVKRRARDAGDMQHADESRIYQERRPRQRPELLAQQWIDDLDRPQIIDNERRARRGDPSGDAFSEGDTHLAGEPFFSALRQRQRQRLFSRRRQQKRRIVYRHDLAYPRQQRRQQIVHLHLEHAGMQASLRDGLQLTQFLIRRLCGGALSLNPPPLGDVAHDGDDGELRACAQWTQADLDRKLGAISSPAKERQIHAHRARVWLRHIARAQAAMAGAAPLRNQRLDRLTQQFLTRIAEHALCLLVDEPDAPVAIHREQRVWREFDDVAVLLTGGLRA